MSVTGEFELEISISKGRGTLMQLPSLRRDNKTWGYAGVSGRLNITTDIGTLPTRNIITP